MAAGDAMTVYAYYDYINFGHYPHELADLPRHEKAMVMAFIDHDSKTKREENAKMNRGKGRR